MRSVADVYGGKTVIAAGEVDGCRCVPGSIEDETGQRLALILNRNRSCGRLAIGSDNRH